MSWIEQSLMARKRRRQGQGRRPRTGSPSRSRASSTTSTGPMSTRSSPSSPARWSTVETHDAFEGKITSETDKPSEILNFPFLNPQTGPIAVEGAEKGDCLAVQSARSSRAGRSRSAPPACIPEFGGLVGTGQTAMLNAPLPEKVKKLKVDENGVYWSRQDHAALRALHRHHRHQPGDRGDLLAAARLLRRQHGPARRGAGRDHLPAGEHQGRAALSRRLPCGAGRRRALRRRARDPGRPSRSRST